LCGFSRSVQLVACFGASICGARRCGCTCAPVGFTVSAPYFSARGAPPRLGRWRRRGGPSVQIGLRRWSGSELLVVVPADSQRFAGRIPVPRNLGDIEDHRVARRSAPVGETGIVCSRARP
jgi:hypothetical protein